MVRVLQDEREAIAQRCVRYGVARLDVFGSALRDDFRPGESDVDLLVADSRTSASASTTASSG